MYTLKNDQLSIGVKKTGAELCSLKKNGSEPEYLWQGNPELWSGQAPNLFPVVGGLKEDTYFFEGHKYSLPRHGFLRNNKNFSLREQHENQLIFQLNYSEETLKIYPFKFTFEISFTLKANEVHVSHRVFNLDEKPLYFSLGGHPAFNVPHYEDESLDDYLLEFDQDMDLKSYTLTRTGLIKEQTTQVLKNDKKIKLHKHLFDRDALIFKNIPSKRISLRSKTRGNILIVEYEDFKHLGIWAKPAAPFVCLEPWLGYADVENTNQDFKTKEGINELMPSRDFRASYTIRIE
jgi:galactose mutarotase-like enzyme